MDSNQITKEAKQKAIKLINNTIKHLRDFQEDYLDAQDDLSVSMDNNLGASDDDSTLNPDNLSDYDSDFGGAFEQSDFGGFEIDSDEHNYDYTNPDPGLDSSEVDDDIMSISKDQHLAQDSYQKLVKINGISKLIDAVPNLADYFLDTIQFNPNTILSSTPNNDIIPKPQSSIKLFKQLKNKLGD